MRWRRRSRSLDEVERLNDLLDGGVRATGGGNRLDGVPEFRTATRLFHLDVTDSEPEPRAAFTRKLETTIMRQTYASQSLLPLTGLPSHAIHGNSVPPTVRGRHPRSQSLSWFAAAALLVLVSALAVGYFMNPRADRDGTSQLAVIQDATLESARPNDEVIPLVVACTVEPRDFQEILNLLQWRSATNDGYLVDAVPPRAPNSVGTTGDGPPMLPEGAPVSQEDIEAVTATFGEYFGCGSDQNTYGRLALVTDDQVVRLYYPGGIADNYSIAALNDPPTDPAQFVRYEVGDPTYFVLFDFRQFSNGQIAAYLGLPSGFEYQGGATPVPGGRAGYVVFAFNGDRWLIDEYVSTMG